MSVDRLGEGAQGRRLRKTLGGPIDLSASSTGGPRLDGREWAGASSLGRSRSLAGRSTSRAGVGTATTYCVQ